MQKTYNWYSQLKKSQSRAQTPSSRKREHQAAPKPPGGTLTQSPLQKSGRLQSVVTIVKKQPQDQGASRYPDDNVPARWYSNQTFQSTPYHLCGSPEDKAEPFVLYITDKFGGAKFQDEVNDFGNVFGHRTAFVARFCMATAVYFEIAWVRGYRWVFPNIPPKMERMTSQRGAPLPSSPKESTKCNGVDLSERCLRRWRYFLALMQYWKDETSPFQYGGVIRYDSKVLLYCMFRIKAVLKTVKFDFHHYAVKSKTMWGKYASRNLTPDQITTDCQAHQQTHDDLLQKKGWMQRRYEDEADLEFEVIKRVCGDVDRVEVHRGERRRHPGNEDEYLRFRQKIEEDKRARGEPQTAFEQALTNQHERATRDQRRESESRERQWYAREQEEQIDFEQSEPYPMPMSEPDLPAEPDPPAESNPPTESDPTIETDPPAELEPSSLDDTNPKVKISLEEYRGRSAHVKEDDNAAPPAVQDRQATATVGSHTPCYDEHRLELDYHDDVPAIDSHESFSCSDYIHQLLDEEHITPPANMTQPPTVSKEAVPPEEATPAADATAAANPEWEGWGPLLQEHFDDRVDVEDLLQGPSEPVTATEEAVLLDETPTIKPLTDSSRELTPAVESQETPAAAEEPVDSAWCHEVLAGLENLTPEMLAEVSAHIDRLRQLATPPATSKSSPPGLSTTPTVCNPMEEALLHATSDLGALPSRRRTPTCLPGTEETERAAAQLVQQMSMSKAPGTPARGQNK